MVMPPLSVSFAVLLAACAGSPPPRLPAAAKQLPLPGEAFLLQGREAFVMLPANARAPIPWVLYAPTLPAYPSDAEIWLFERLLAHGIAIAGIDVGESYGNAAGCAHYDALYDHVVGERGFAARALLLARSRGGLMTLAWAAGRPERVAAFAGIYPVCDLRSYPGLAKAAPAFGTTIEGLTAMLPGCNPIERLAPLAAARVPFCCVHGDRDTLVPLRENSQALAERVRSMGGEVELHVLPGAGHDMNPAFFRDEAMLAFLCRHAQAR